MLPTGLGPAAASLLLWRTRDCQILTHNVGLWQDGISLPFVADTFTALMLGRMSLLGLSAETAQGLLDTSGYLEAVLGR